MIDPIALIDAARTWRAPEHRAQAIQSLKDQLGDEPMDIIPNEQAGNMWLEVTLASGIMVVIPCNL